MSDCPEPEVLAALAEGRLEGRELDETARHVGRCEACYEVLASSVKDLDDGGWLPRVTAGTPVTRTYPPAWLAAAAALLVVTGLLAWLGRAGRAPSDPSAGSGAVARTEDPRTPAASPPLAVPGGETVSPEAWSALRLLGPAAPWTGRTSVGFVPDARADALRLGMDDVQAMLHAGARDVPAAAPTTAATLPDPGHSWRRVGRILEASRVALHQAGGPPAGFFESSWATGELAFASKRLREAGVADAELPDEIRRAGPRADSETAQRLLDRVDRLFGRLL